MSKMYFQYVNKFDVKGFVWYYIDRGDQENESVFLCKKRFFVEKIVSIQSDHGAVYLDINSLLIADVKWSLYTLIDAGFQSSVSIWLKYILKTYIRWT